MCERVSFVVEICFTKNTHALYIGLLTWCVKYTIRLDFVGKALEWLGN